MPISRREFLKLAAAATAIGAGAAAPALAQASERTEVERPVFALPDLDPAHDGLRVAQLSDLHVGPRTPPERIRDAIARVNALRPDLVVLTGDFLSRHRREVGLARELLVGLEAPTVAVLGNHDHWVDARGLSQVLTGLGYDVLRNQHTTLRLRGAPFSVVGIDDRFTGHDRPAEALAGVPAGSRLVLAHAPRTADDLRARGEPLLCLTGHTHGGQIGIPVLTPVVLRAVLHEPYLRGAFHVGAVQLYVNRGIGNSGLSFRIGSAPEVTLAELRRAAA